MYITGKSPLFFINGNAFTLEAVFCGGGIAAALMSAIYWFKCFNVIYDVGQASVFVFEIFFKNISAVVFRIKVYSGV